MAKKLNIERLPVIMAEVESKVAAYNAAVDQDDVKLSELAAIEDDWKVLVNEYTSIAREVSIQECMKAEHPLHEACKRLTFDTIAVKDEKVGDSDEKVKTVVVKSRPIPIDRLHKRVRNGVGHDTKWIHMVDKLNLLFVCDRASKMGIPVKEIADSYAISDIARQLDMGKNPMSKTNILKTLTTVVQAMIGEEYKPLSHDVAYIATCIAKKSNKRALQVSFANPSAFRILCMEVCHRLIIGGVYTADYKEIKKK